MKWRICSFVFTNAALLAVLLLAAAHKCEPDSVAVTTNRRQLSANMRQAGSVWVIYASADTAYAQLYSRMLDTMRQQSFFRIPLTIKRDDEVSREELSSHPVLLIGDLHKHRFIRELLPQTPFKQGENGFCFEKTCYQRPDEAFKLFWFPHPLQPGLPLFIVSGNSDAAVYQLLAERYASEWSGLFWGSWSYEIYRAGTNLVLGEFADSTWAERKRFHYEFGETPDTLLKSEHYIFVGSPPEGTSLQALSATCETAYTQLSAFTGAGKAAEQIVYHLYPSFEDKGLRRANTEAAEPDFRRHSIHVVADKYLQGHLEQAENRLWLRKWLGLPATPMLEWGLALRFAPNWQQKGYDYWANRLLLSDNLPSLSEITDTNVFDRESAIIGPLGAAVLVDFLIEEWGKVRFLQQYKVWRPNPTDIASLESPWQRYLNKRRQQASNPVAPPPTKSQSPQYLKGFNFAHEGYRVYDGYGSVQATESLAALKNIGANAVAIVPYSFTRNPALPAPWPIPRDAGSENDACVISVLAQARKQDMFTLLKPQIWVSRGWTGDINMTSDSDWKLFFHYYYRWIRHYALLAEIHQVDALSLGVELPKATLGHEQEWRALIAKIRGIYRGKLTYAANWGEEFENIAFWDALDYIGLNCYYPLSDKPAPSEEELKLGFAQIVNKAKRVQAKFQKPLWFTEIGFRSVDAPWRNPHEEAQGRPFNEQHQALCYDIVNRQLAAWDGQTGIFWWKWPSYLNHEGKNNTGFSPYGKKAETIVKRHFQHKK